MGIRKHNWLELESRWIAGEWPTLAAMAKKVGITVRMVQKRAWEHKWTEKREAVEAEATERARKQTVKSMADRLIEANERALKSAALVFKLGLNKFLDEQGKLKVNSIKNETTALNAIKSAIQIEQAILRRFSLGEGNLAEGPIISPDGSGMEELTDAELERIIRAAAIEPTAGKISNRIRRTGGRRTKKKTRGKK